MAACPGEQLDRDPELGSLFFSSCRQFRCYDLDADCCSYLGRLPCVGPCLAVNVECFAVRVMDSGLRIKGTYFQWGALLM